MSSLVFSCNQTDNRDKGPLVATFKNYELYQDELDYFLPDSLSPADSVKLVKEYMEKWVRGHVVREAVQEKVENLDQQIEYPLESFERALVEEAYADYLIETHAKELEVVEEEIRAYYTDHPEKFQSKVPYYQYFFIQSSDQGNYYKVINLLRGDDPENIEELIKWASENATSYKLDSTFRNEAEIERVGKGYYYGNIKKATIGVTYYFSHTEDGETGYKFFRLISTIKPGEILPLDMCKERIWHLLYQQKKQALIEQQIGQLVKQSEAFQLNDGN